jgi:hypothetical protein
LNVNNCRFNLSSTEHGSEVEDQFGSIYGDDSNGFSGTARYACNNGQLSQLSAVCSPDECTTGEDVKWFQKDSLGSTSFCSGEVDPAGNSEQMPIPRRYYPTSAMAREKTSIKSGVGLFHCVNRKWVASSRSRCTSKLKKNLRCYSKIGGSGNKMHFCE